MKITLAIVAAALLSFITGGFLLGVALLAIAGLLNFPVDINAIGSKDRTQIR